VPSDTVTERQEKAAPRSASPHCREVVTSRAIGEWGFFEKKRIKTVDRVQSRVLEVIAQAHALPSGLGTLKYERCKVEIRERKTNKGVAAESEKSEGAGRPHLRIRDACLWTRFA